MNQAPVSRNTSSNGALLAHLVPPAAQGFNLNPANLASGLAAGSQLPLVFSQGSQGLAPGPRTSLAGGPGRPDGIPAGISSAAPGAGGPGGLCFASVEFTASSESGRHAALSSRELLAMTSDSSLIELCNGCGRGVWCLSMSICILVGIPLPLGPCCSVRSLPQSGCTACPGMPQLDGGDLALGLPHGISAGLQHPVGSQGNQLPPVRTQASSTPSYSLFKGSRLPLDRALTPVGGASGPAAAPGSLSSAAVSLGMGLPASHDLGPTAQQPRVEQVSLRLAHDPECFQSGLRFVHMAADCWFVLCSCC